MKAITTVSFIIVASMALIVAPAYAEIKPEWALSMRAQYTTDKIYSVGYSESDNLNKALSDAWNSALTDIVRVNIPELTSLGEMSKESLKSSEYERNSGLDLDRIVIKGIGEANNKQSPYVENSSGKYKVWRLLEWTKSGIEATRKNIISEQAALKKRQEELKSINDGFSTKESVQEDRNTIEKAKDAISRLNKSNTYKKQLDYIETILSNVRCGTEMSAIENELKKVVEPNLIDENEDNYNTNVTGIGYGPYWLAGGKYISGILNQKGYVIKYICQ